MSATAAAVEATKGPIELLPEKVEHLLKTLDPLSLINGSNVHPQRVQIFEWTFTVNMLFFLIGFALVLWLVLAMRKKVTVAPKGGAVGGFEFLIDFVRNNVASIVKVGKAKHEPFLLTCFFFILISNLIGLLPGCKPGTGTVGGTLALAIVVLVYFNYAGVKEKGGWGYIKSITPHGMPPVIGQVIWLIEVVSMLLRPVTLALRLWANMYAGHIILGIFSLLTGLFAEATIHGLGAYIAASPAWLLLLLAMYVLELVVAFVQAYVFTLLTAVYIDSAVGSH
jgi:F-type H+-transporting ATPase subunit a